MTFALITKFESVLKAFLNAGLTDNMNIYDCGLDGLWDYLQM